MPRLPKTTAPEEALERSQHAREDFAHAFESIFSLLDLSPLEQALADRRQAAEAFQQEAQACDDEAHAYFGDRSEAWQESKKGQTFATWIGELALLADFAGEPMDEVWMIIDLAGGAPRADFAGDPSDALPALPEMPTLEE